MTPDRYIIIALLAVIAALSWVAFAPSEPLPPIDPKRHRSAERMHWMALDNEELKKQLEAATGHIEMVTVIRYRDAVKHDSIEEVRMGQSDSIQAEVLMRRLGE